MKKLVPFLIVMLFLFVSCNQTGNSKILGKDFPSHFSFTSYEFNPKDRLAQYPFRESYTFFKDGKLVKTRNYNDGRPAIEVDGTYTLEKNKDGEFIKIELNNNLITLSCTAGVEEYILIESIDKIINRTFACDGPNYVFEKNSK